MNKCIQSSCSCTEYKGPAQNKRLSCQECGHQASEHRKLTAVDHFIKSQVTTSKRNRCTASISSSEIPTSPVFSIYDLIPIPRDDSNYVPSMENSVQCMCRGFQTADVIRLCQNFRTHSLNDAMQGINSTPCSFCNHPLSSHASSKQDEGKDLNSILSSNRKPALGAYEGLALKSYSSIPFSLSDPNCLELILPLKLTDQFLLLSVGRLQDSDKLCVAVICHRMNAIAKESMPSMESSSEELENIPNGWHRKRVRQSPSPSGKNRRSQRLATKKAREEEKEIFKQLKGLKGSRKLSELDILYSNETKENDLTEKECEVIVESATSFVKRMDINDNYQTFPLPQELLDVDGLTVIMAALRITEHYTSQDTMEEDSQDAIPSQILLTVGAKGGSKVFLAVVQCSDQSIQVSEWHQMKSTENGILECLSLKEVIRNADSASELLVIAGMSSGLVCVWKAVLDEDRLQHVLPVASYSCGSQCFVLSCSPKKKIVAAGTISGECVFSFLTNDDGAAAGGKSPPHLQAVQCCCAPIKCITWAQDGRLVAVGACDDAIQVLQCVEPPEIIPRKASILNYFKRFEGSRQPRFIHTHTLKGHSSFVSDMKFTHSYFLVSLGWDSQVLFWGQLAPKSLNYSQHRSLARVRGDEDPCRTRAQGEEDNGTRVRGGRPDLEAMEPVGGYKLGPSPVVEFLPTMIHSPMGCGLIVVTVNKLGGITVAYFKQS